MKRFTLTLTNGGEFVAMQEADEDSLPRAIGGLVVALVPGDRLAIECYAVTP